jgi:hypothetical protein
MIIDRKFNISATHTTKGTYHSERSSVLFLAKDLALVPTLEFYRSECAKQGAEERQITGITLLIGRVKKYQEMNPTVCKVADIDPGPEEIKVNAPNEG